MSDESSAGHLSRKLHLKETASLAFSTVGATAGIYSLFNFAISTSGPAMFWGWILVAVGVLALCLLWAELASRMPLAGAFYHWGASVAGTRLGWWIGWLYLFAQCWALTGWYFLVPLTVGPLFGIEFTPLEAALVTLAMIVLATVVNAFGIELLGKVIFIGVVFELVIAVGLTAWLFFASEHQPLSIFFNLGHATSFSEWLPMLLLGGIFMPLWVMFTFESAGAVGEETKDARRVAPKAILIAFGMTVLIGVLFLAVVILAIPDPGTVIDSPTALTDIMDAWLPAWASKVYLVLLLVIEILGCNAFFTAVSRQLFGMARAQQLPGGAFLSRTFRGTPTVSIIVVGIVTAVPLVIAQTISALAAGATSAIYIAYFLLAAALLVARFRGWPRTPVRGGFNLGRWGMPVNIVAVIAAGAALVALQWPSDLTNPVFAGLRVSYWLLLIPVAIGIVPFVWWLRRRRIVGDPEDPELLADRMEAQTDHESVPAIAETSSLEARRE